MTRIRVGLVDDSAIVRQVVGEVLARAADIELVFTAADPLFAIAKMQDQWPDVIVLDIEMPRMDGLTFLKKIMAEHPTPVVICSSLTEQGARITMDALAAGAFTIITKPKLGVRQFLQDSSSDLLGAVRAAAAAKVQQLSSAATQSKAAAPPPRATSQPARAPGHSGAGHKLVAIGTSTGGTLALERILRELPANCPPLLIVQHMPEKFTAAFAERLDGFCAPQICEAAEGDKVLPGQVLIAPGGRHMQLVRSSSGGYAVAVADGPPVNRHKPSVDVLFRSVAREMGAHAVGVILTGMGDDGARGLREMLEAGAHTLAQDEASCVVYGMPKEAVRLGAVSEVLPLDQIAERILALA